MNPRRHFLVLGAATFALLALLWWRGPGRPPAQPRDSTRTAKAPAARRAPTVTADPTADARSEDSGLRAPANGTNARPNEAVLIFKDAAAYQRFLAGAGRGGLRVLARLDALNSVRVHFASSDRFAQDLAAAGGEDALSAEGNILLLPPPQPTSEQRRAYPQIPVGNHLLEVLGLTEGNATWGRGVTIAILDTGVAADSTFGTGRLRCLDLGLGTTGNGAIDGHATAVASLAAGAASDAAGVAPAANLLSIRVTAADGTGDVFTVAQGILAAVDAGAQVINLSLGGDQASTVLSRAIDYAVARGVVLVAAAGNDQAAQLSWPAADPRVVSVGAVDAVGQQVIFSNSGPQLQLTAPGYGLQTAWSDGTRVLFDGTSGSAPIVSGAIAAVMSQNRGLTAVQALAVLTAHSSDGGAPGTDPDYGHGSLNLGWALAGNDPNRVDTAVSSHYLDPTTGALDIVIQNRSARGVNGLELVISVNGTSRSVALPWLEAGASTAVPLALDQALLARDGSLSIETQLKNPPGIGDSVPSNNARSSLLTPPPPEG